MGFILVWYCNIRAFDSEWAFAPLKWYFPVPVMVAIPKQEVSTEGYQKSY